MELKSDGLDLDERDSSPETSDNEQPRIQPQIPELGEIVDEIFIDSLTTFYKAQGRLPKETLHKILRSSRALLKKQPSLVDINLEFNDVLNICGDIHGQFFDLCNIFDMCGPCSSNNCYLFNGDFVDRGAWSLEVLVLLLVNKLARPQHFHLGRGNHESEDVNRLYGFQNEVFDKYDQKTFALIQDVFNWLPLAHRVNESVLVMHGGLSSRDDCGLEAIRRIKRGVPVIKAGQVAIDLLWSDPREEPGRGANPRGFGCLFGPDVTSRFLSENGLIYIVRSHECVSSGYDLCHDDKIVTVFSAPNYCDRHGNKGAVCVLHGDDVSMPEFKRFEASPHPKVDPMAYASLFMKMGLI